MKLKQLGLVGGVVLLSVTLLFLVTSSSGKSNSSLPINSAQGKWQLASVADAEQFKNPSVPVVVVRVTSGLSDPDSNSKKQFLVKEVIVENRSNKKVSAVTLRWTISPLSNRLVALKRGEFPTHKLDDLRKQLLANQKQTLKLSHPRITQLIEGIPNIEGMGTEFAFVIGVAEVAFEDGSTWKETPTDVANKSTTTD